MNYSTLLHLLFLITFLQFLSIAQTNATVAVGTFLTATDNSNRWLSPSGDFAFGFQQIQNRDLFLLSIWYNKIPDQTIVWYGNEGNTVPRGSRVELTAERGLVLNDPQGQELWYSRAIVDVVAYGFMNDTGNFVVRSDSVVLWESFSYPTDTMLPTQMMLPTHIMEPDGVLYSRAKDTNFSRGRFQLRLLQDGNLVLNTRDVATNFPYDAYYISFTYDPSNDSNSGYRVMFNETGYMFILIRNGQRSDLTPRMSWPTSDYYHRVTLNFDGVLAQYYHPKNFTGRPNWTALWSRPDDICANVREGLGSGACGYNSICRLGDDGRPTCQCPQGYSLLDPNDKYGSCKANFTQSCDEDAPLGGSAENLYGFVELDNIDWPTSDYERSGPYSEEECRRFCMQDCFCAVAILKDGCWKKKLPLSYGRYNVTLKSKAFLKIRKGDLPPPQCPKPPIPGAKKDLVTVVLVGSLFLGSSVFINFILVGAACLGFFNIYQKKNIKHHTSSIAMETNLRCFSYDELAEATNGFKEELGRGAFGIVYKGAIQMGSSNNNIVAVKKLDRVVQDNENEFKTEVNVIAQTHHKNLVRLLGFCDEGEHRLLVYEYMSNGTLARFLFGDTKPGWIQRTHIALGIARGLSYLHEECSTQVIHCDIKPQNILLDEYHNGRIADFGLAKLLMLNQSRTNTGIRGTKGYVAPEWFRNIPVTVKVDVYSFGVLLLEIISCRRSVEDVTIGGDGERAILTDWVWECFQEGKLDALVENDVEALNDWDKLERFVMVGIWCIQEDPSLRPTMRQVCQMLEGVLEVNVPPCSSLSSTI